MRSALLATAGLLATAIAGATAAAQPVTPPDAATLPTTLPPGDAPPIPRDGGALIAPGDVVDVEADTVSYNDNADIVSASGSVQLSRDAWKLTADTVDYNRATGAIIAKGHVVSVDPEGNQAFGDMIEVTDTLKGGNIDNILVVLNNGGRLAADSGRRDGRVTFLRRAVYSPCAVVNSLGCPHDPVWEIKAQKITYNQDKHRITYRDARLEMFGVPIVYLPRFSHPDSLAERAGGLLQPGVEIRRQLGFGVSLPYYLPLGPDRDITITPRFYSNANPALQLQARRLLRDGPVEIDTFFTYSRLTEFAADGVTPVDRGDKFRGYLGIKGQLQHSPEWRSTFSLRLTTDDTFNRLYNLDFDDTLRSTYALERFRSDSYLSIAGFGFQGLRATDKLGEIPIALPLIDYDWRPQDKLLGGQLQIAANALSLFRTDGQSLQRGLAYARWDRSALAPLGQRITATALVRGDVYNIIDPQKATIPVYAGESGVRGRVIPVGAVDFEWPFAGPALGGTQTITPRAQFVVAPTGLNNGLPNEDSRAIELEDISLFDLNRFPGYDRYESGSRFTWGIQYNLDRPGIALRSEIGQSIRLAGDGNEFPIGTGLSDQFSDFVGRTNLKIGRLFEITHRFRVDRNSFAVRRNEVDIVAGTARNYVTLGYLKLNRNILLEDLQDRSELRAGGRIAFARFWSAFGSAIIDLTTKADNPQAIGNGFSAVRHRIGIEYEDECFRFGVSWRRDYIGDRDFRPGNSFLITLAFKTIGR